MTSELQRKPSTRAAAAAAMPATQPPHLILPVSHDPLYVASGSFQNIMFVPQKAHFLYNRVTCFGEEIIKRLADGDFN
jgi:hypothetical protein